MTVVTALSSSRANDDLAAQAGERRARLRPGRPTRIAIVGGGVAGTSVACELVALGVNVVIIEERNADETVSAIAAGLIEPVAGTRDPVGAAFEMAAFARSIDVWAQRYAAGSPFISERTVLTVCSGRRDPLPWAHAVADFRVVDAADVHADYANGEAAKFTTYVVETNRWLAATRLRLGYCGVQFIRRRLVSLDEVTRIAGPVDGIVNASGLGAARLAADPGVYRGDGHIIHVLPVNGVDDVFMDETRPKDAMGVNMLYIIPRRYDIVIGGTLIDSNEVDGTPSPTPGMQQHLLALAARIEPRLGQARLLDYKVGSRPRRYDGVRVELDTTAAIPIVHCYGQGGSGWTLAPALAESTVDHLARTWADDAAVSASLIA